MSISLKMVQLQGDGRTDMSPIRIALCITELDIGGAERCLAELAVRLDRERFAPVVYCLAPPPEREEASFLSVLKDAGVEVHCLGGRRVWQFPAVVRRLTRLLKAQKPQIIQTFLFHANVTGRIAARGGPALGTSSPASAWPNAARVGTCGSTGSRAIGSIAMSA